MGVRRPSIIPPNGTVESAEGLEPSLASFGFPWFRGRLFRPGDTDVAVVDEGLAR